MSGGKTDVRDGDLTIRSASFEDSGVYTCVARSDRNTADVTTSVQIKLHGKTFSKIKDHIILNLISLSLRLNRY